ncbi:MAG: hypothetical protein K0S65_4640 [Labilithrix sp.]|nr:hypothetical protein [Labilithrix sp.]
MQRQFERARELCVELGEVTQLFEAVFGLWYTRFNAAERLASIDLSRELLEIAEKADAPPLLSLAHHAAGATALADGNHIPALTHLDASLSTATRTNGSAGALGQARNPVVVTHCFRAWAHVYLGNLDRAVTEVETAMALAREIAHPLPMTQATSYAALVRRCRREPDEAESLVRLSLELAREHGFPYWTVVATSVVGWVAIERGDYETGIAELRRGLRCGREEGIVPIISIAMVADVVDALTRLGRLDEARSALDEAALMCDRQLVAFHAAEIHRLEGALWSSLGAFGRARRSIEHALEIAGAQQARLLELRAATALVRLSPDDAGASHALHRVASTFPEGSAVRDILDARALLQAVALARRT